MLATSNEGITRSQRESCARKLRTLATTRVACSVPVLTWLLDLSLVYKDWSTDQKSCLILTQR